MGDVYLTTLGGGNELGADFTIPESAPTIPHTRIQT